MAVKLISLKNNSSKLVSTQNLHFKLIMQTNFQAYLASELFLEVSIRKYLNSF